MTIPQPILIAACGNASAGADAFGSLVLHALAAHADPNVQLLDLATNPTTLLDHLAGRQLLIIVDAALSKDASSSALLDIDYFSSDDLQLVSQRGTSTHALSIANQLELARTVGMLPPSVRLVAAVIQHQEAGDIQAAQAQVPKALQAILARTRFGASVTPAPTRPPLSPSPPPTAS